MLRSIASQILLFVLLFVLVLAPWQKAQAQISGRANPDIGVNALMLYRNSNRGLDSTTADRNGFDLQEVELLFKSDVDPYWTFRGTLSLHQEVTVDTSTTPATRTAEYKFEPEELYAESLNLPSVTLRFGKFKAALGKHNQLHTHAFAFVDAPLANSALLGQEGFNDVGASASFLMPTRWFSELVVQAFSGQSEGLSYFKSRSAGDVVGLARYHVLWELSDETTVEVGASAANGKNSQGSTTKFDGTDFTVKWRESPERAVVGSLEFISREYETSTKERGTGIAGWLQAQFSKRWWAQVRAETLEIQGRDPAATPAIRPSQNKQSVLIGFIPSEFSAVRVQYDRLDDQATPGQENPEQRTLVQLNYSIGAHPAHAY